MSELTVHAEEWPYGLRCGECCCLLEDGDRYSEHLTGLVEDIPAVMIVCVPCGLPPETPKPPPPG